MLKRTQGPGFWCWFPQPALAAKETCCSRQHLTAATSPRFTGHGSPLNLEGVCSTERGVPAAKREGRGLSVSRGLAWDVLRCHWRRGGLTPFCVKRLRYRIRCHFPSESGNPVQNWFRLPHPKGDLETQTTYGTNSLLKLMQNLARPPRP